MFQLSQETPDGSMASYPRTHFFYRLGMQIQQILDLICSGRYSDAKQMTNTLLFAAGARKPELERLRELSAQLEGISEAAKNIVSITGMSDRPRDSRETLHASSSADERAKRQKVRLPISDIAGAEAALGEARRSFASGDFNRGVDIYEQLIQVIPQQANHLLAELYDQYQSVHQDDRYLLYVSREYNFDIRPHEKVLDIGSGHAPFPFATHLADLAPEDDSFGRAGIPMKKVDGKPFFECSVEDMPFEDKEFDFVYCSHVLEHTLHPEKACRELMRVAKRGYIETPTQGKDLFMNTAKMSNHHWGVHKLGSRIIFHEYSEEDKEGILSDIVMSMHCAPETQREKALSALILLRASLINVSLYWEESFEFEVKRLVKRPCYSDPQK